MPCSINYRGLYTVYSDCCERQWIVVFKNRDWKAFIWRTPLILMFFRTTVSTDYSSTVSCSRSSECWNAYSAGIPDLILKYFLLYSEQVIECTIHINKVCSFQYVETTGKLARTSSKEKYFQSFCKKKLLFAARKHLLILDELS